MAGYYRLLMAIIVVKMAFIVVMMGTKPTIVISLATSFLMIGCRAMIL